MSPPVQNNDNHDDDTGVDTVDIIENISTLTVNDAITYTDNVNGDSEQPQVVAQEEDADDDGASISLSSATSATSIASTLSDGISRPRSASLSVLSSTVGGGSGDGTSRPNSTPRQRSAPRSRPRSNPQTRTPMRQESPLLVTGRGDDNVLSERTSREGNVNETSTAIEGERDSQNVNANETMVRNIFNTRRYRVRAGSIPEENEEEIIVDPTTVGVEQTTQTNLTTETSTTTTSNVPRAAGHLLTNAVTSPNRSSNTRRSTNPTRSRLVGLSDKQRPSHRKIRRWNNDRFIGTSSEQLHVLLDSDGTTEQYWRQHYMPNYPCSYRSEFAKLSTDETKIGQSVRERFLKGEVAAAVQPTDGASEGRKGGKNKKSDGMSWMERNVRNKFQKLGVSHPEDEQLVGRKLFETLSTRIQSILFRSCGDDNDIEGTEVCSFASQLVTSFEEYLVSLALAGSKKDVKSSSLGYPPQQPQHTYDMLARVFSSSPKIIMRSKTMRHRSSHSNTSHAVLIPTVHFYFSADEDAGSCSSNSSGNNANDGQVKSSAFCRILLYAVCQFHGLESSSSFLTSKGKHRSKRSSKKQGGSKVVTVQGGVLLAPHLKLLDHVKQLS